MVVNIVKFYMSVLVDILVLDCGGEVGLVRLVGVMVNNFMEVKNFVWYICNLLFLNLIKNFFCCVVGCVKFDMNWK